MVAAKLRGELAALDVSLSCARFRLCSTTGMAFNSKNPSSLGQQELSDLLVKVRCSPFTPRQPRIR